MPTAKLSALVRLEAHLVAHFQNGTKIVRYGRMLVNLIA
jgi:hypothetical protein